MKLFGNRKSGGRAASRKEAAAAKQAAKKNTAEGEDAEASSSGQAVGFRAKLMQKWKSLTGTQRGLILLAAAILLLICVIAIVYFAVVKPPDVTNRSSGSNSLGDASETFNLPSTVTIIKEIDPETGEEVEVEIETPASHKADYYNILIAGTDKDGGRTDTIMIARLDVSNHTVALMSVPRDTLISARYSVPKINSAYGAGGMGESGMETLRTQLARLLGFEVDGYILIDFDAFAEIIELVGDEYNGEKGIWFDVPQRMYYTDPTQDLYIDLYAGYQHLNADECEQLVRYRYGYANADIGRIAVQQDFVRALANQCLKIGNITKIQSFAEIFSEYVTTDLTVGNMVYFGKELLSCNFDEMETFTLEGENVSINGGSYYRLYTNKMLEIVNEYFNPYDVEITAANITAPSGSASSSGSTSTGTTGSSSGGTTSSSGGSGYTGGSTTTTVTEPEEPTDGESTDSEQTEEPDDTTEPNTPEDPDDTGNTEQPEEPTEPTEPTEPDTSQESSGDSSTEETTDSENPDMEGFGG
jgi:LCP family protein required for cell wall assembly